MAKTLRKSIALGLGAFGLSILAHSVQADVLPAQNLTFSDLTSPPAAGTKTNFSSAGLADWYRGPPALSGDLVYLNSPGSATSGSGGYPVYGPFANPPPGGNFVQADGNPDYESEFKQNLTGLVAGTTYTLSFWQAAGQETSFGGATTEQWAIFLGNDAVTVTPGSPTSTISFGSDLEDFSSVMNTPSEGVSPWEEVSVSFTLASTALADETLTFLAWGDDGNTANLPPTVFLAGVNSPSLVPEPASLTLFGAGLLGLGAIRWRRRAKRNAAG